MSDIMLARNTIQDEALRHSGTFLDIIWDIFCKIIIDYQALG